MNKVLAVVVTYNRLTLLKECIQHLLNQTYKNYDILIVNNHSTDNTSEYLKTLNIPNLFFIDTEKNIGGAGGFNLGVRYAAEKNYTYAWLMDDDTFVTPTALENLMSATLEIYDFGYLASTVNDKSGKRCILNLPKYVKCTQEYQRYKRIKTSTFVSFFIPITIVNKIGLPIKEFFIWNDDIEYALRISDKYKCYEVSDSIVTHMVSLDRKGSIATDDFDHIERYRLAYRNDHCIYKRRGIKGKLFYYCKCIYNTIRIIFKAKGKKIKRIKVLWRGVIDGFNFDPPIEML